MNASLFFVNANMFLIVKKICASKSLVVFFKLPSKKVECSYLAILLVYLLFSFIIITCFICRISVFSIDVEWCVF